LAHHYRSDWEWFDQELVAAQNRLTLWRSACSQEQGAPNTVTDLVSVLVNDLDTPKALEIVDKWALATTTGAQSEPTQQMQQAIDALLGII
jgi:L-cysteine:1D-myo-inositol 2-amino-2-deoxy-alpha-D-glucopyranoside ligase